MSVNQSGFISTCYANVTRLKLIRSSKSWPEDFLFRNENRKKKLKKKKNEFNSY